jgi:hypothetical protein
VFEKPFKMEELVRAVDDVANGTPDGTRLVE